MYTIGHSTRSLEELTRLLAAHGVELVVDVRRFPASRRHPHFNREALAAGLASAGLGYHHAPDLGGRRTPTAESPNTAWREAGFRGYADYMATETFGAALDELLELAAARPTAILCAEAVPWRCHRRLIADALLARGLEVRHILSATRAEPHEVDPNAVVLSDGSLVYPAAAPEQAEIFPASGSPAAHSRGRSPKGRG